MSPEKKMTATTPRRVKRRACLLKLTGIKLRSRELRTNGAYRLGDWVGKLEELSLTRSSNSS